MVQCAFCAAPFYQYLSAETEEGLKGMGVNLGVAEKSWSGCVH